MRFVFISDLHLTHKNPPSRLDNFLDSVFEKLNFVFNFCKSRDAVLLIGGDIFSVPVVSPVVESRFIDLVRGYNLPLVYIIPGNHDLMYSSFNFMERTSYNVLLSTGLFKTGLYIGDGYILDFVNAKGSYGDYSKYKSDGFKVILVGHGYIEGSVIYDEWVYQLSSLKGTGADVVCLGHIHNPYEIYEDGGFYLLRPGGLSRLTSSYDDVTRDIYLCYFEFVGDKVNCEYVGVPYKKDVFSNKTQVINKVSYSEIKDYISKLNTTEVGSSVSVLKYVESLDLRSEVKSLLLSKLSEEGLI